MSDGYAVRPDTLRSGASLLLDVANRVQQAWQQLAAQAGAARDSFGGDLIGALIGASYQVATEITDLSVASVADGLAWAAGGLAEMADTYAAAEQASRDLIDQIGGALG